MDRTLAACAVWAVVQHNKRISVMCIHHLIFMITIHNYNVDNNVHNDNGNTSNIYDTQYDMVYTLCSIYVVIMIMTIIQQWLWRYQKYYGNKNDSNHYDLH